MGHKKPKTKISFLQKSLGLPNELTPEEAEEYAYYEDEARTWWKENVDSSINLYENREYCKQISEKWSDYLSNKITQEDIKSFLNKEG